MILKSNAMLFTWVLKRISTLPSLFLFPKGKKTGLCLGRAEDPNHKVEERESTSVLPLLGERASASDETAHITTPPAAGVNLPQLRIWRKEPRRSQVWTLSFAIKCGQLTPGLCWAPEVGSSRALQAVKTQLWHRWGALSLRSRASRRGQRWERANSCAEHDDGWVCLLAWVEVALQRLCFLCRDPLAKSPERATQPHHSGDVHVPISPRGCLVPLARGWEPTVLQGMTHPSASHCLQTAIASEGSALRFLSPNSTSLWEASVPSPAKTPSHFSSRSWQITNSLLVRG